SCISRRASHIRSAGGRARRADFPSQSKLGHAENQFRREGRPMESKWVLQTVRVLRRSSDGSRGEIFRALTPKDILGLAGRFTDARQFMWTIALSCVRLWNQKPVTKPCRSGFDRYSSLSGTSPPRLHFLESRVGGAVR